MRACSAALAQTPCSQLRAFCVLGGTPVVAPGLAAAGELSQEFEEMLRGAAWACRQCQRLFDKILVAQNLVAETPGAAVSSSSA